MATAAPVIRYTALPRRWPGKERKHHKPSPFKVQWSRTEKWLLRELAAVGAKDVTLAVDARKIGDFREDGGLRADARPATSWVILGFTNREGMRLEFPCNTYGYWMENVHAIALSLENLRAVDRYEVTKAGEQYVGFKQLGSGTPAGMTREQAADVIAEVTGLEAEAILGFPSVAATAIKVAKARTHPDIEGADGEKFLAVVEAEKVLAEADAP